ncbi:hypothetical protein [Microvirga solisilvae]|uniref:hypothetical protein n=1 Tax=Microvirga solisilvae TaxID=2919498 RepID=UPI001FAF295C|nr:hypothetical protein [Microvirga solisilvae]
MSSFLSIDMAAIAVADAMLPMVEQMRGLQRDDSLSKYYRYSLKWMVRGLENFVMPHASVNAMKKAEELDIGDIRRFRWSDQTSKMMDPKREIFHWEHVVQVSDIVNAITQLHDPHREAIAYELKKAKIAWILKSENKKLIHKVRPIDAYERAGIDLLPPLEF